jgi:hypothetical protein
MLQQGLVLVCEGMVDERCPATRIDREVQRTHRVICDELEYCWGTGSHRVKQIESIAVEDRVHVGGQQRQFLLDDIFQIPAHRGFDAVRFRLPWAHSERHLGDALDQPCERQVGRMHFRA